MKNIFKKIKKIWGIMGVFLFSICNKVFAEVPMSMLSKDVDSPLYGVPERSLIIYKIFDFGIILLIPFILLYNNKAIVDNNFSASSYNNRIKSFIFKIFVD